MPYLNLDPNYFDHPKTRRLIGILGVNAEIYPLRLWAYCAKIHPKDGAMRGYSTGEVEAVMGWVGTPKVAVRAMTQVGYLVHTKRGYNCVDWLQHQGHLDAFSRRSASANKIRWDMVRQGLPVGVQKGKLRNPPTVPSVPSVPTIPTIPTVPGQGQQTVDLSGQFKTAVKALADKKARAAKTDHLLALKWSVSGDHNGKRVQDLPADYCEWALTNLSKIGQEYRDALMVRVEQKNEEAIR